MKTIVVETKKVVAHKADGMPVIETIKQKLSPELTFNKFVRLLPNQGYTSAKVVKVLETSFVDNKPNHKELDEIDKYQAMIDDRIKPTAKAGEPIDYKAKSEKQEALLKELEERLRALEKKGSEKSPERANIEDKANELGISFRANIGDEKLLEKIKEVEPEFEV